jgi:Family of unknown function (DUF6069)
MRTSTVAASTPTNRAAARRRRVLAVAGGTTAAAAVWLVARTAGTEPTVTMDGQAPMGIGLPMVVLTALAASLAAWIAVSVLERLTRHARPLWPAVALVTLAASFLPVLSAQADGATRVTLAMMHVAVAAVLLPGLLPHPRGPRRSPEGSPS